MPEPPVGESLKVPFLVGELGGGGTPPESSGATKPPVALQVELQYADGTTTRWDSDSREAKDRPTGISFRTQRYTGFADAQVTLNRRVDREYPDLGLLDGITLVGHDGSVAYDGRVGTLPRSLQQHPQITVQAQGWMSHAKDEPFVEVYVDRDLSKWVAPAVRRVNALLALSFTPGSVANALDEAGHPAVQLSFQDTWVAPYKPVAEAWWPAQPGVTLGSLYYNLASYNTKTMTGPEWHVLAQLSEDDARTGFDSTINLYPGPSTGYRAATEGAFRSAALLQLYYEASPGGTGGAQYQANFEQLAVYGSHGLVGHGENPVGFYVSDMIANIAQRFAPKLDTSGIQDTTFAVPHASFTSETLPYDAFQTLNTYHRWEMAVFENRKLQYYPIDLTDYDWEIRLSDPGTQSTLQGDDVSNLTNGVIVRYTDLNTGYETRLTPETTSQLKDESPNNPANINGDRLYTTLSLSVPTTEEGAIQIGRAYLAEFNEAQATGSLTVTGHVRDRAGHWQPAWKVRAGDRLIISDLPNDSVRVVGETDYNHDAKTNTIAVDASFKRLDAILARLTNAVEASNVSLPGGI